MTWIEAIELNGARVFVDEEKTDARGRRRAAGATMRASGQNDDEIAIDILLQLGRRDDIGPRRTRVVSAIGVLEIGVDAGVEAVKKGVDESECVRI